MDLKASSNKKTTLEFELTAEGVDLSGGRVFFILDGDGFNYELSCKRGGHHSRWSVIIPKQLSKGNNRKYLVRVLAEEFAFEPIKGEIKFVDSDDVKVTKLTISKEENQQQENKAPPKKAPVKKAPVKKAPVKNTEQEETIKVEESPSASAAPTEQPASKPQVKFELKDESVKKILDEQRAQMIKAKREADEKRALEEKQLKEQRQKEILEQHRAKIERAKKLENILMKEKQEKQEQFPSVKTLTPKQLADLHGVPIHQIELQLLKGTKVETEHTTDKDQAREIALDHLKEDPTYYDKLQKMEQESEEAKTEQSLADKVNIRSDTGEKPATNESAAEGSTSAHDISGGSNKPKKDADIKKILGEL